MSDEINKNPAPRVVKGTGFFTPMDLAPGEVSAPASIAPAPSSEPTITPVSSVEPSVSPEPIQTGNDESASAK